MQTGQWTGRLQKSRMPPSNEFNQRTNAFLHAQNTQSTLDAKTNELAGQTALPEMMNRMVTAIESPPENASTDLMQQIGRPIRLTQTLTE